MSDILENGYEVLKAPIHITFAFKTLKDKGNLVYEYNPFNNYRLTKEMFEYDNSLWDYSKLVENYNIVLQYKKEGNWVDFAKDQGKSAIEYLLDSDERIRWIQKYSDKKEVELEFSQSPIIRRQGELVNFETDELSFDFQHPVMITPQYSYDNSVNLIFNDGKNEPRLINSRFSATEKNQYQIVDRVGNNDTNIYDQGDQFDIDTSLLKKTRTLPELTYNGTFAGGCMPIGNYHFYFKYVDADGNESDFVAESGLTSVFIGTNPFNIRTGVRDENSNKGVSFTLKNLDPGYQYISVYYSKSTGDIWQESTVAAFKIDQKFLINSMNMCFAKITGYESRTEIPLTDINLQYQIFQSVKTQAVCQNRLFLGNVQQQTFDYKELQDISLRFCPYYSTDNYYIYKKVSPEYEMRSEYQQSYYNTKFIYNKVGYWPGEIYRFGIVYIANDGSLSPVFNVRGITQLPEDTSAYSEHPLYEGSKENRIRKYIAINEQTNELIRDAIKDTNVENCKGVVKFPESSNFDIYKIHFGIAASKAVDRASEGENIVEKLKELGIKGYFFVRQRRIPTILGQGFTIGVDNQSHTPLIPYNRKYIAEGFLSSTTPRLTHDYKKRQHLLNTQQATISAIFPEYDVDSAYYNCIFGGDDFQISQVAQIDLKQSSWNKRYYYLQFGKDEKEAQEDKNIFKTVTKIQAVEDGQKLCAIDQTYFSARAGEATEVRFFEFLGEEKKQDKATNLVRGEFGPFLGMDKCPFYSSIINIYIPGYNTSNIEDFYTIRYNDKTAYYAIGDRKSISEISTDSAYYRGDCYICQFTHRVNRNFQDPSAPVNDLIVDPKCWEDNFKYTDGVLKKDDLDKINLGDVNAIQMGQWITFTVRSTKNLNIRTIDESNTEEVLRFGQPRGFYPYHPLSARGAYKIPEALCYNKGFEKSVSERWNMEIPETPFYQNDFTNRISYSDIQITNGFQNSFRTFPGDNYYDYPKSYGSIIKLVEVSGSLLCVFEHAVCILPVKERTVAGEGAGGSVFINTDKVLPEAPTVVSDIYGSQWPDSIVRTPTAVYGVDTVARKIWKTNGQSFQCISDISVQEFLNNNITLTERELTPIIGVRNVKSHYNAYKGDVMFTFYDNLYGHEEKAWNLCWNEQLSYWVTFYSWVPSFSENIHNQYYSFDREASKYITKLGLSVDDTQNIYLSNNRISPDIPFKAQLLLGINKDQNTKISYKGSIEYDPTGSKDRFELKEESNGELSIVLKDGISYNSLCSELYIREAPVRVFTYDESKNCRYNTDTYYTFNSDLNDSVVTYLIDQPGQNTTSAQILNQGTSKQLLPVKYCVYNVTYSKTYKCWKEDKEDFVLNTIYTRAQENKLIEDYTITLEDGTTNTNYSLQHTESDIIYTKPTSCYSYQRTIRYWTQRELYTRERNNSVLKAYKVLGKRVPLEYANALNPDKIVQYLKVKIQLFQDDKQKELSLGYSQQIDCGFYEVTLAIIPEYNLQFLTTDFWRHGQAGIIDIADPIKPTYWYGKQHPFEFEFVVATDPGVHKIFDSLEIISNKAEPESFHYEIVGECYDFAKDKKNIYIRQEALKELYQYNGEDIIYDPVYKNLMSDPLVIPEDNTFYSKSTIFPAYYTKQDPTNDIRNFYYFYQGNNQYTQKISPNYAWLSGSEIVYYKNLNEFRILNHVPAVNIANNTLLKGNMLYKEDKWDVQITPINYIQKNERKTDWINKYGDSNKVMVPAELNLFKMNTSIPGNGSNTLKLPDDWERNIVKWSDYDSNFKEVKMKDKYLKVRIRYSGEDLAIISAINTLYSISYA